MPTTFTSSGARKLSERTIRDLLRQRYYEVISKAAGLEGSASKRYYKAAAKLWAERERRLGVDV